MARASLVTPLSSFLALVLVALPVGAAPPKVVVLPVAGTDTTQREIGQSVHEQLLTELAHSGQVETMGTSDLSAVLGLERQRQLMGCTEKSAACLTEISAALGAEWIIASTLGRVGKTLRFDLKVIHASDAKVVFRDGRSLKDASAIFDVVTELTRALLAQKLFPSVGPVTTVAPPVAVVTPPVATVAPPPVVVDAPSVQTPLASPRVWPWVTVGAGAVALGFGVALTVDAASTWSTLNGPDYVSTHSFDAQKSLGARHNTNVVLGPVLGGVGLAALAGGALVGPAA